VVERDGIATASVTFNDERVTADTLVQATTNAGFPSTVRDVKATADLH
jgi:periplasmic mercuric ion binding protein